MQNESGNLAFNEKVMRRIGIADDTAQAMTVSGTINKVAIMLALVVAGASISWLLVPNESLGVVVLPSLIVGLVLAFATIFRPNWAKITAPAYAAVQGLLLGAISEIFEASYPGIAVQAVGLTFAVFVAMLIAYKTGVIRVTEKFRTIVVVATAAIMLFYVISIVAGLFGASVPLIHSSGTGGIIFSLFVVGIAALNLALDFHFIEQASAQRLEKKTEWYGAFGLMVTLIWLYIEILRLLAKSRD